MILRALTMIGYATTALAQDRSLCVHLVSDGFIRIFLKSFRFVSFLARCRARVSLLGPVVKKSMHSESCERRVIDLHEPCTDKFKLCDVQCRYRTLGFSSKILVESPC